MKLNQWKSEENLKQATEKDVLELIEKLKESDYCRDINLDGSVGCGDGRHMLIPLNIFKKFQKTIGHEIIDLMFEMTRSCPHFNTDQFENSLSVFQELYECSTEDNKKYFEQKSKESKIPYVLGIAGIILKDKSLLEKIKSKEHNYRLCGVSKYGRCVRYEKEMNTDRLLTLADIKPSKKEEKQIYLDSISGTLRELIKYSRKYELFLKIITEIYEYNKRNNFLNKQQEQKIKRFLPFKTKGDEHYLNGAGEDVEIKNNFRSNLHLKCGEELFTLDDLKQMVKTLK